MIQLGTCGGKDNPHRWSPGPKSQQIRCPILTESFAMWLSALVLRVFYSLLSLREMVATDSAPGTFAYRTAEWPRPPREMTPTCFTSEYVVMPAHSITAAEAEVNNVWDLEDKMG